MSFNNVKKLPQIQGLNPSSLATGNIPATGTYLSHLLNVQDQTGAAVSVANMISNIRNLKVDLDGQNIIDAPAEILLKLQNYYYGKNAATGDVNQAGQLPLFYSRDFYRSQAEADVFALGMQGIQSFNIEIEGSADVGATNGHTHKIEVRGESIVTDTPIGQHARLQKFPQTFGEIGEEDITDLPREPNVGVLAYHIAYNDAVTDLDEVTVIRNSSDLLKFTKADLITMQQRAGRTPQFNAAGNSIFTIDFALSNTLNGFFDMRGVTDLRIRPKWSVAAPASYIIYREAIFGLDPARR